MAFKRIRDPLHNLIEFSRSKETEQLENTLWKVMQTHTFQRLRRVKQLGFSDMVYPGATHSRFTHSIGVFHTARQLMEIVHRHFPKPGNEQKALAAALLHDLGHGPFSHAFEQVGKRLKLKLADHEYVSDFLIRNGEIKHILDNEFESGFSHNVADVLQKSGKKTIHHSIVSGQFDADRLDYMQRDRLMTGTQHSAIDFQWLIANLEVANIPIGIDDTQTGNIDILVLNPKAIQAAEAYVLGLFQLYTTVYLHKTTRGIEKLFTELLVCLITLVQKHEGSKTGLDNRHPLIRFASQPDNLENVLSLDDSVVWGALSQMSEASDPLINNFARRLKDRKIFKCRDIWLRVTNALNPKNEKSDDLEKRIDHCCTEIQKKLTAPEINDTLGVGRILIDSENRSAYKTVSESEGPLNRINIRSEDGRLVDLRERSSVVAALTPFKLFRVYVCDTDEQAQELVEQIVKSEIEQCLTHMPSKQPQ